MAAWKKQLQPSKKILIVKINAIGDVVMALPMAAYLRSHDPAVHISWICGNSPAPLLEATQTADRIIKVDEKELLAGPFIKKFWALLKIWKQIAFTSFDQIFIAHLDPRYRLLILFTRAREKKMLSLIPGRYHADEYLRLASGKEGPVQCKAALPKWNYPLSEKLNSIFDQESRPMIALAPGGAKNALADDFLRRWPIEHYVRLAEELLLKNYAVAITGALTDAWVLPYFSKLNILNLVGKTTLPDLVSFYNKCALIITHDSGPLHLAKLSGAKTIALFGPTMPSEKIAPEDLLKALWGGEALPCRPCYNGKRFIRCKNNLCLRNITVENILKLISI